MQPYPSEVVHVDPNDVIWQHLHFGAHPGVDESTAKYIQPHLCSGDRHSKPAGQEKEKKTIAFDPHDRTGLYSSLCVAFAETLEFNCAFAEPQNFLRLQA